MSVLTIAKNMEETCRGEKDAHYASKKGFTEFVVLCI